MNLRDSRARVNFSADDAIAACCLEDKDVQIGEHPGKSLVVENTSHRKWMRVYMVDGTIYLANCGGPFDRAAADGPIAMKTLDSFKLAK